MVMKQMCLSTAHRTVTRVLTLIGVVFLVGWGGIAAAQSNGLLVSSVTLSGSNLILSGSGALAGATYYVLASTNMTLSPVALWNKISTNTFAAAGTFTNSIPIDPSFPQEFFAIAMTLPDQLSPTAPGILIATGVGSNQVNLSWFPATDNVGVTEYLVERQGPGSTNYVQIGTTTGTNFSDTGLTANTNYSYRVRAMDAVPNLGPYSSTAAATTFPRVVVAYAFDEGTGTVVTNAAGSGNNGTVSGATWTNAGKYGSALVFNGTSARVTIPDSVSLHLTTGMTLEAWVDSSVVNSAWRDVIEKGNDDYYLMATSDNSSLPAAKASPYSPPSLFGSAPLPINSWTQLAATYDGAILRLYVNGTQVASRAQTGNIPTSANALTIGSDPFYGQYFSGMIDEVRIYNVALTAAQIQLDMNIPVGNIPSAPGILTAMPVSASQINLLWTASIENLGVTGYMVERQQLGSTNFVQIGTTTDTSYSDTGLTANTNYSYRVRATDGASHLGPYSNVAQAYAGLSISPRVAVLTVTLTQQFTTSSGSASFIWSVDGVVGGSTTSGTITAMGLYAPPNAVGTHTVTATTLDQAQSINATVYVTSFPGMFTHHNDNFRTGQNLSETVLTPTNVNSANFGKLFSFVIDGISFASPLYVANVNVPGQGFHNVVYVATEHDSVYAFDADGLRTNPLWQVSFINPAAGVTPVPCGDTGDCGDIPNEIGITSTPVIDPASGTLYVVAKTKEVIGGSTSYVQRLHALDVTTGAEKFGGPVVIQASVPGTGVGSQGGQLPFLPLRENQRTALLLLNGVLYFGFGSHGDIPPYHGWVLGYNATTLQQTFALCITPNNEGAGVWQGGGGLATDATGNIYFATGDGTFNVNTGGIDYGDSYVKMSPTGVILDYFTPHDQLALDQGNLDLCAGGVLLLPDQPGVHPHMMIGAGKNATAYLVDRDNMGHFNPNNDSHAVQTLPNIFPNGTPEPGNFIAPVYFHGYVYFSPVNDTLQVFHLSNGLLTTAPTSRSSEIYSMPGGTLAISANGNTNGILWAVQRNGTTAPGVLRAYDPSNLGIELYNSSQAGSRDTLDFAAKYSVPLVANGRVFVSSMSQLTAYGLLP